MVNTDYSASSKSNGIFLHMIALAWKTKDGRLSF